MSKTIIITTSSFGNPVTDYFKGLSEVIIKNNYTVVFIFDRKPKVLPQNSKKIKFYRWPNLRPTKLKDFIFFYRMVKKYKPILCLSNFGSTNVVSVISFLLGVKYRMNYVHTTTKANLADRPDNYKWRLMKIRKRFVYKLNTILITNSNGTKQDTISNFKLKEDKIKVLPILLSKSRLKFQSEKERSFSVLIVGRLDPVKNHLKLLECFKEVVNKYPSLILKIVGEGRLKSKIISKIKEFDLCNNVKLLGYIENAQIDYEYSNTLMSISSSIDEAYGIVNIESLREGTPLICTKTAGSLDILMPEVNGEFYKNESDNSFLNAFEKIINNWQDYSENSKKIFENKYSLPNNIEYQANFIINLIKN